MMCIMHDGTPYGHLSIEGQPVSTEQLARLVGTSSARVVKLLAELELHNVFSRDTDNPALIYSRRMVRDEHKRDVAANNGSKGGNPALRDKVGRRNPVIPPVVDLVNQHANQKPTPSVAVAVASSTSLQTPPPPGGALASDLLDRIPESHRGDLLALLSRVPEPTSWAAESLAALDGMPGHVSMTAAQLATAVRDYNANGKEPSLRLFRGYLRDAAAPPRERGTRTNGKKPPGEYVYEATTEPVTVR